MANKKCWHTKGQLTTHTLSQLSKALVRRVMRAGKLVERSDPAFASELLLRSREVRELVKSVHMSRGTEQQCDRARAALESLADLHDTVLSAPGMNAVDAGQTDEIRREIDGIRHALDEIVETFLHDHDEGLREKRRRSSR